MVAQPNSSIEKVYIGSDNPVKLKCTAVGFRQVFGKYPLFEFIGKNVNSGVPDQPMSDEETLYGAENRARELKRLFPDGNYFVGIEGGVEKFEGTYEVFAWVVILNQTMAGKSRTASFQLPGHISDLLDAGLELGPIIDLAFNKTHSKRNGGAVSQFTHGVIDRREFYRHAIILALVPFINPEIFP